MDLGWLFGSSSRSDVDLVLVEEEEEQKNGEAAAGRGGEQRGASPPQRPATPDGTDGGDGAAAAAGKEQQEKEDQQQQQQQQQRVTLPAHAVVLMGGSGFCRAKLENWADGSEEEGGEQSGAETGASAAHDRSGDQAQEQQPAAAAAMRCRRCGGAACCAAAAAAASPGSRPRVVLHVPRGQLSVGRRLVRAMYEAAPALGDLSADELVQLLLLADRYDAPRVVAASAAAAGVDAAAVAEEGLDWALVRAGFKEPAASPPCAALLAAANAALQRQLGDLELVWADASSNSKRLQERLVQLPFGAVKALLASDETRVASENTAFYTVQRWRNAQQVPAADARAKELLGLLRPQHMTPHYARTVFCSSALAEEHLDSVELKLACTLPLVDVSTLSLTSGMKAKNLSWRKPARPRSALADEVMVGWRLPLAELKRCVEARLTAGKGSSTLYGSKGVVWQGWPLHLSLQCTLSAGGGLTLGLFLHAKPPCSEAVAVITYVLAATAAAGGAEDIEGAFTYAFTQASGYGHNDFFRLGKGTPPRDWPGLEAALRGKGVVHGCGGEGVAAAHLKLRARVTRLQ